MNLTLRLCYSDEPQRPTAAWWLAGSDAASWLNAVGQGTTGHERLRWTVVSHESHGSIRGVLVVPPTPVPTDSIPLAVPFGLLGRRLFVPVSARFEPATTDDEVAALLPDDDAEYVWLPTDGLIRCEAASIRAAHELLLAPPRDPTTWDAAEPGEKFNSRLLSIRPDVPLDLAAMFEAARESIGSQAGEALPAAPGERSWLRIVLPRALLLIGPVLLVMLAVGLLLWLSQGRALPSIWPWLLLGLGIALLTWLRSQSQNGASGGGGRGKAGPGRASSKTSGSSWFAGVRRWFAEQHERYTRQLDELRHREVRRLLHMLADDPDEGLRFALPLNSDAPRGRAEPGARLLRRGTDFSLTGSGGGPADFWNLDERYRQQLLAKYRELANREIGLGRHRRAAYIFAELLGDWTAAAQTLTDGGHFREAAAIYDQRLKNSRAAAACLEKGGLLSEAIVIYAGFGEYEKCGELHERLDQHELAASAYRRAVETKREQHDFLSAARLLEHRLKAPDEAFDTLLSGWPHSAQASPCLDESFALLARIAAHDRAARQISHLSSGVPDSVVPLTASLAKVASHYPDATIRNLAADRTRVLVAQRLDQRVGSEREPLLDSLRRLAPQDRLLLRDCERFQRLHADKNPPRRTATPEKIRIVRGFRLPEGDWRTAVAHGRECYVAGWRGSEVLLVRGLWNGTLHQSSGHPWQVSAESAGSPILMAITQHDRANLFVHVFGADAFSTCRVFPATDRFGERLASGHRDFDAGTLSISVAASGDLTCFRVVSSGLCVSRHAASDGRLVNTTSLDVWDNLGPVPWTNEGPIPFLADSGRYYFGGPAGLFQVHGREVASGQDSRVKLVISADVHQLIASERQKHLAACLDDGGMLWWGDPAETRAALFGSGLTRPLACFLRSEILFVASSGHVEAYQIDAGRLLLLGRIPAPDEAPIAVLPLPNARQAAVIAGRGRVIVYEVA